MKKTIILAVSILFTAVTFAQTSERFQKKMDSVKASRAAIKLRTEGIKQQAKDEKDSIKFAVNQLEEKPDSIRSIVTYSNKDGKVLTDTCMIMLKAKDFAVIENYGQFDEKALPFGMWIASPRFYILPKFTIQKVIRVKSRESFDKSRIISIKKLPAKK